MPYAAAPGPHRPHRAAGRGRPANETMKAFDQSAPAMVNDHLNDQIFEWSPSWHVHRRCGATSCSITTARHRFGWRGLLSGALRHRRNRQQGQSGSCASFSCSSSRSADRRSLPPRRIASIVPESNSMPARRQAAAAVVSYQQLLPLGGVIGGGRTRPRSSMRSPRLLYRKPHSSLNEPSGAFVSAWEGGFGICLAGYWPVVWASTAPATPIAASARTDIAFM
jgi:hypothetical protein